MRAWRRAFPYSLEMMALKKMPAKSFGILMSVEPAIAALSGVIFLDEHLHLMQWLAIICIMIASTGSAASVGRVQPAVVLEQV
jgi:inner membrane transporter RhtA